MESYDQGRAGGLCFQHEGWGDEEVGLQVFPLMRSGIDWRLWTHVDSRTDIERTRSTCYFYVSFIPLFHALVGYRVCLQLTVFPSSVFSSIQYIQCCLMYWCEDKAGDYLYFLLGSRPYKTCFSHFHFVRALASNAVSGVRDGFEGYHSVLEAVPGV